MASGCGGSSAPSGAKSVTASALLHRAKTTLDGTHAVHFQLTSQGTRSSGGGATITGGQGDIVRPDRLRATFDATVSGFSAAVNVVAVGSTFEAQLPFQSGYRPTDPSSFGLGNPAQLLDPTHGLSAMLVSATSPRRSGQERLAGELLDKVSGSVPGDRVPVLPDKDRSRPVALVAGIDPADGQLRQVRLTGPFTSASADSTYVVTLTRYGEHVAITLPGS